jgi:quercetin dioxygenase-like cupin family protein
MSTEVQPYLWEVGALKGVTFTFPEVGSELPAHSHPEGEAHCTFVRKGSFEITRPAGKIIVGPGTWLVFEPNEVHSYRALEPNSKITNVVY